MPLVSNFAPLTVISSYFSGGQIDANCRNSQLRLALPNGTTVSVLHNSGTSTSLISLGAKDDDEESSVTAVRLERDGRCLLVARQNLLIQRWDIESKSCLTSWRSYHRAPVQTMDTVVSGSSGASLLATGSADSTVRLWNLEAQSCVQSIKGFAGAVTLVQFVQSAALGAGGLVLFAGAVDGSLRIIHVDSGAVVACLQKHSSPLTSFCLSQDSAHVITTARDSIMNVWSTDNWQLVRTIPVFEAMEGVLSCPGKLEGVKTGSVVIAAGASGTVQIWNYKTGKLAKSLPDTIGSPVVQLLPLFAGPGAAESDDSVLVVTEDHRILRVGVPSLTVLSHFVGSNEEVLDLAFLHSNKSSADLNSSLLNSDSNKHPDGAGGLGFVVCSNSADLRLYKSGSLECTLVKGHTDLTLSVDVYRGPRPEIVRVSPDSSGHLDADDDRNSCVWEDLFASGSKDNTVRVWAVGSAANSLGTCCTGGYQVCCLGVASGHTNSVSGVKFSKLAWTFLATVSNDTTLKIWALPKVPEVPKSGTQPNKLESLATVVAHQKDISCVDVSPNDKLVATGSMDKTVRLWAVEIAGARAAKLSLVGTIPGHRRGVWDLAFSPMDQVIATASGDFSVKIFALSDNSCVRTFEGHQAAVLKVNFLSSGLQLVSSDTAGLIKLWTIKTSECVKTYDAHEGKIWALNQSATGNFMISGGSDSAIIIWKDVTESDKKAAEMETDKNIVQDQRLNNLVHRKSYVKALRLAIALNRPFQALNILKAAAASNGGEAESFDLKSAVSNLDDSQLRTLIEFIVQWNTNVRTAQLAQLVLATILRCYLPEKILNLPDIQPSLEALIIYSERHFDRLSRMRQQAAFVDFTWKVMRHNVVADGGGMKNEMVTEETGDVVQLR